MLQLLKTIFFIALSVLILDGIYLSSLSNYFSKVFKEIQGSKMEFRIPSAVLCYVFIIFSIYYFGFVLNIGLLNMFILGVIIYGIYELTNHATIKNWPLFMVIFDTLWGGILYSSSFSVSNYLLSLV